MTKLLQFNEEQREAIAAREGVYAAYSGPGSGKTAVVAARYRTLLDSGVDPKDICSLTFTAEAASEMRRRAKVKKEIFNGRPHGFMTFHSLALAFATLERDHFPFKLAPFPLATGGQAVKLMGEAARRNGLEYRHVAGWISDQKRRGIRPWLSDGPRGYPEAYADYDRACREAGILDFDSLLMEMVALLRDDDYLIERWQYKWIQVDEAQDADTMQFALLQRLSRDNRNVFAVGDINQAVYEWRGAAPSLFDHFSEMFPNAKTLFLGMNYRSTAEIVSFVREVMPVKNGLEERLRTENEQGVPPTILPFAHNVAEAEGILELAKQRGTEQSAVLARTNAQLRLFEDMCMNSNVKYRLLGRSGFWEQEEIKNVLAFIRLAVRKTNADVGRAIRSPFACTRFIRKKELLMALAPMEDFLTALSAPWLLTQNQAQVNSIQGLYTTLHGLPRFNQLSGNQAGQAVDGILREIRAFEYYTTEEDAVDNSPQENLQELWKIANRFRSLQEFIDHARKAAGAARSRKGLTLSTVHQMKGKEANHVFVVGCSEGILPHKNGDLAEEARIFYVAVSRAAKTLTLSFYGTPSRFIPKSMGAPDGQK